VLAGAVAGVVAAWCIAPADAGRDFFSVTAQVLPVLLLGLALEARIFGATRRLFPPDERRARFLESVRVVLEYATVLALVAGEWQSVDALTDTADATRDPTLTYLALAWGFVAIAALAVRGAGRARITAEVQQVEATGPNVFLRVALSNVYGDHDLHPLVNMLVPPDAKVIRSDADQHVATANELKTLPLTEQVCGGAKWRYISERPVLTAGDADITYYHVSGLEPGSYPVVVRVDHIELPGGRVQRCGTFTRPE